MALAIQQIKLLKLYKIMTKNKDIIFICKKCLHNLYVTHNSAWFSKMKKLDCPNCGEEAYENWILSRLGNFEKDYEKE